MGIKVKLNNVRLAFPVLFTAKPVGEKGELKFSASFLMAPDHSAVAEIEKAMKAVAKEKWGEKGDVHFIACQKNQKICFKDGDVKPEYEGFPGNVFLAANNTARPAVFDRDRSPLTEADGKPYAGCYVNAVVEIWAMDNHHGKRICASLGGVQFLKDGDAFSGGGVATEDDFDLIDGADDDSIFN